MKVTTGRQLLEWLQKQPTEFLDDKIMVTGEDVPISLTLSVHQLRQDIYENDECIAEESDMMDGYRDRDEMLQECEKKHNKGGIIIYI